MKSVAAAQQAAFSEVLLQQDRWTRSTPATEMPVADPRSHADFLLDPSVRATCSALGCKAQVRFWKRSARPVFEGQWACSHTCAIKLVHASLRKQMTSLATFAGETSTHRHRIPLGLVLLDRGIVTQYQLRQALDAQKAAGHGRIGYWLEETCGIAPEKIARAIAAQWNRPVLSAQGFSADRMATVIPECLRRASRMLPLRVAAGKILYVAFVDEVDLAAVTSLERMTGLTVEPGLLPHNEFDSAEASLNFAAPVLCRKESTMDPTEACERTVDILYKEQPVASRIVPVRGGWWLRLWLEPAALGRQGTLPATGEDVLDVLFRR